MKISKGNPSSRNRRALERRPEAGPDTTNTSTMWSGGIARKS
jgi:hypothetical protein